MLMRTLKGTGFGFLVMAVLLLILAFVVVYTPFPYDMSGGGALGAMMAGMFIGGVISSVGMPGKGWMRGLVCGLSMLLVLVLIGLIINGGAIVQSGLFKGIIAGLFSAVAGGITGINIKL